MTLSIVRFTLFVFVALITVSYAFGVDATCGRRRSSLGSRVLGGTIPKDGDWPWLVFVCGLLLDDGCYKTCTGTFIGQHHVLTAGHCVTIGDVTRVLVNASFISVKFGIVDRDEAVEIGVKRIILHPNFRIQRLKNLTNLVVQNDVAILKIDGGIGHTAIAKRVCLPNTFHETFREENGTLVGDEATVVGFGTSDDDNWNNHTMTVCENCMREAQIEFRTIDKCQASLFDDNGNTTDPIMHQEDMICAGSKDKGPNHGDSGGPILVERHGVWYQVGVTSWGNDYHLKSQDEYPTIFSRITSYCEWIEVETEGDAKCVEFDEKVDDVE